VIRLFQNADERLRKNNEKLFKNVSRVLQQRKDSFRENALSKLVFLYPDMEFAMTNQCQNFAGYSRLQDKFIHGNFLDDFLPHTLDLEDHLSSVHFPTIAQEFHSGIRNFMKPKDRMIEG